MSPDTFKNGFKELCDWFGRKSSLTVTKVFFGHLNSLCDDEWQKAIEWAIATQQFMPTPKMLFEAVRGDMGKEGWKTLLKASQELDRIRYESNYLQLRKPILEGLSPEVRQFIEDEQIILPDLLNKTEAQLESLKKKFLNQSSNQITPSLKQLNGHANTFRLPQN